MVLRPRLEVASEVGDDGELDSEVDEYGLPKPPCVPLHYGRCYVSLLGGCPLAKKAAAHPALATL